MGGGPGGPLYLCSRPTPCGGAPPRNTNWVCQDLLRHVIGGEGGGAREGGGAASKIVYRLYSSDPHESVGAQTHTASSRVIHRHKNGAHGCRRKINKRENSVEEIKCHLCGPLCSIHTNIVYSVPHLHVIAPRRFAFSLPCLAFPHAQLKRGVADNWRTTP